jgi:PIN domain nuclease of toxin-antitoxin system
MNLLLDTHALLWWLSADKELSRLAKTLIDDNERNKRFISAVSTFEIANKFRIGKLPGGGHVLDVFDDLLERGGFHRLDISMNHSKLAGLMPGVHRDPFDRMLAAQCKLENLSLITADPAFREFGIDIIW